MPLSHRSAAAAPAVTAPDANLGSEPAAGAARTINAAEADDYIERRSRVRPPPGIVEAPRAVMSLDEVSTLARSVDIEEAAARVGATLKRVSSREMAGPCPACGGVDRFSINPAKGVFNCRGSGGGDVIAMVRHCLGLDFRAACEWVTGERAGAHRYESRPRRAIVDAPRRPGVAARVDPDPVALDLWHRAQPIAGTLAERYLVEWRGLAGPWPPSLRYLASARHPHLGHSLPALVAGLSGADRRVVSVQLTYLREADGSRLAEKRHARRTFGRAGDAAVRLAPACEILGLAEGLETAMSAMALSDCPTWAVLGKGRFASVAIPDAVRTVHLFADADDNGGGLAAARAAAALLQSEGRAVEIHLPPDGVKDFNDMTRRESRKAAA